MSKTFAAIAALTVILAASSASAQMLKTADTAKGKTFVDAKGMTLYTFDKDPAGRSACNGDCAVKWPPVIATDGARAGGDYSIVTRDDGRKQWAFRGKPLYTWPEDQEPGDKYGDNYLKVWHVVPG